jgi:hypothetical protein
MVKELSNILKGMLVDLPFLHTVAGLAQPVIDTRYAEAGTDQQAQKIQKKLPVSYDIEDGMGERALVPDGTKKGILYFEDFGTTPDTGAKVKAGQLAVVSRLRLVCWVNRQKILEGDMPKYEEVTANFISEIVARLVKGTGINSTIGISRLFVTLAGVPIQDANIFSRYNYDEAELQYLRPPYEYFALDLQCKFWVSQTCFKQLNFVQ